MRCLKLGFPCPYSIPRHRYYRIPYRIPLQNTQAWNGSCKGEEGTVTGGGQGEVAAGVSTTGRSWHSRGSGWGVQSSPGGDGGGGRGVWEKGLWKVLRGGERRARGQGWPA